MAVHDTRITWQTCSLANRQLRVLWPPFLLDEKHGMLYCFWLAVYILQLMVILVALEALHYIALFCVVYTYLAYLFICNSTTTNAADSVPPRGKGRNGTVYAYTSGSTGFLKNIVT